MQNRQRSGADTVDNMIPYIAYESGMARLERTIKRLWILCIVMFLAFVLSNGAWIYYESQWQTAEEFDMSVRQTKNIVYKYEPIIFKHLKGD